MSRPARKSRTELLTVAIEQFSAAGYAGVSMRDLALACEMNVASLYHHFEDKDGIYLAAMQQAFAQRAEKMLQILRSDQSAKECLRLLVHLLCQELARDCTFSRLLLRELLDGDAKRLQLVAETVFSELTSELTRLCRQLNPDLDPFLLGCSLIGLVVHHFNFLPLKGFLPGYQPQHADPVVVAEHILQLLNQGCGPIPSNSKVVS
ncbi:MAG: TetR/AcrR family transcriptional regulator [Geopsychrobacter sp.]|nr:TetR/AcrR family transcriptional regulator [Geopsychrobacter sp.]